MDCYLDYLKLKCKNKLHGKILNLILMRLL